MRVLSSDRVGQRADFAKRINCFIALHNEDGQVCTALPRAKQSFSVLPHAVVSFIETRFRFVLCEENEIAMNLYKVFCSRQSCSCLCVVSSIWRWDGSPFVGQYISRFLFLKTRVMKRFGPVLDLRLEEATQVFRCK